MATLAQPSGCPAWLAAPPQRGVAVLEADPDLAAGLGPLEETIARRHAQAPVEILLPGSWDPEPLGAPLFGLLVVEGLLLREVTVEDRVRAEPIGPGDLIRPWDETCFETLPFASGCAWTVAETATVAILDERFGPVVARWPQLAAGLLRRTVHRSQRLALQMTVDQLQGVDLRLRAMLWHLAERWGRVTPDGVVIPFALTHETLGRLIGARRPSVTTALSSLAADGTACRRADGTWLLAPVSAG